MSKDYPTLLQVAEQVWAKNAGRADYQTTLGDFVGGLTSMNTVASPTGDLVLTPHGFQQLARDRLGLPVGLFSDTGIKLSTKLQILQDKAHSGYSDELVKVRVAGNHVDAVVSNDYSFFDNGDLLKALVDFQVTGLLPDETRVMTHNLSPDGRNLHLRLISPDMWDFTLGENGRSQPFHGNLVLSNNELAMGSFRAQPAITRTSCLNSTIGQSIFAVNHKFADRRDFVTELQKAVLQISGYAHEMGEVMRHTQNINVEHPLLIFDRIGRELGLPAYVLNSTKDYWQAEGSRNTLYDVVQSLVFGTQRITEEEGRRKPNWNNRTEIESKIWGLSTELQAIHEDGNSVEDWYITDEEKIRQRILSVIKGYQNEAPIVEEIAYQVERLEI